MASIRFKSSITVVNTIFRAVKQLVKSKPNSWTKKMKASYYSKDKESGMRILLPASSIEFCQVDNIVVRIGEDEKRFSPLDTDSVAEYIVEKLNEILETE